MTGSLLRSAKTGRLVGDHLAGVKPLVWSVMLYATIACTVRAWRSLRDWRVLLFPLFSSGLNIGAGVARAGGARLQPRRAPSRPPPLPPARPTGPARPTPSGRR